MNYTDLLQTILSVNASMVKTIPLDLTFGNTTANTGNTTNTGRHLLADVMLSTTGTKCKGLPHAPCCHPACCRPLHICLWRPHLLLVPSEHHASSVFWHCAACAMFVTWCHRHLAVICTLCMQTQPRCSLELQTQQPFKGHLSCRWTQVAIRTVRETPLYTCHKGLG